MTVCGLISVSWTGATSSYQRIELIFPFLCALIFALKDVTVRWGLSDGGGDSRSCRRGSRRSPRQSKYLSSRDMFMAKNFAWPPANVARWFIWSGIFTGGAFLFMYVALSMERVMIIAPLINSYAVFVLLLTPFMARRIESVTWRKVAGAAMVVAGIFMVSLGKD